MSGSPIILQLEINLELRYQFQNGFLVHTDKLLLKANLPQAIDFGQAIVLQTPLIGKPLINPERLLAQKELLFVLNYAKDYEKIKSTNSCFYAQYKIQFRLPTVNLRRCNSEHIYQFPPTNLKLLVNQ